MNSSWLKPELKPIHISSNEILEHLKRGCPSDGIQPPLVSVNRGSFLESNSGVGCSKAEQYFLKYAHSINLKKDSSNSESKSPKLPGESGQ